MTSPYNTYVNNWTSSRTNRNARYYSYEAVLNPEKNDYIYFCASVERFGYHEFAATYPDINVNAKKYADWINSTGSKKIILKYKNIFCFFSCLQFQLFWRKMKLIIF